MKPIITIENGEKRIKFFFPFNLEQDQKLTEEQDGFPLNLEKETGIHGHLKEEDYYKQHFAKEKDDI